MKSKLDIFSTIFIKMNFNMTLKNVNKVKKQEFSQASLYKSMNSIRVGQNSFQDNIETLS